MRFANVIPLAIGKQNAYYAARVGDNYELMALDLRSGRVLYQKPAFQGVAHQSTVSMRTPTLKPNFQVLETKLGEILVHIDSSRMIDQIYHQQNTSSKLIDGASGDIIQELNHNPGGIQSSFTRINDSTIAMVDGQASFLNGHAHLFPLVPDERFPEMQLFRSPTAMQYARIFSLQENNLFSRTSTYAVCPPLNSGTIALSPLGTFAAGMRWNGQPLMTTLRKLPPPERQNGWPLAIDALYYPDKNINAFTLSPHSSSLKSNGQPRERRPLEIPHMSSYNIGIDYLDESRFMIRRTRNVNGHPHFEAYLFDFAGKTSTSKSSR